MEDKSREDITHRQQPAKPTSFDIKNTVLRGSKDNLYDGGALEDSMGRQTLSKSFNANVCLISLRYLSLLHPQG